MLSVQFPNCTAKVEVFSVCANSRQKNCSRYNIVLDFKGRLYTYKQFGGIKQATEVPKRFDGCPL